MSDKQKILDEVRRIAKEIAHPNASDVDTNSRFPIESITALKNAKMFSAGVPEKLGGFGLNIIEQGELCRILATQCASTAMVLGMHFIKVSSIVHFGKGNKPLEQYLQSLVEQQRIVGSVTSEEGIGGNLRNSIAAVERYADRFTLTKQSTCLSYGAYADDLLITCRKDKDSAASEQVVVLALKDDLTLTQQGEWDAMGMRGTCSPPFTVKVDASASQIFEPKFAEIAARTMVPDTHYIWSTIWLGIACDAAAIARSLVQSKARKDPSHLAENARELAQLEIRLERFKDTVKSVGECYLKAHIADDFEYLSSISFSLKINALKLNASQLVVDVCMRAMTVCGFAGYLNNSPYSVARHVRDALSAAPMIGNGRIIDTNATNLLAYKGDGELKY